MTLDNQLKNLENLKVRNIEKDIRKIASNEYDTEKIYDEIDEGRESFQELFMEKFIKAVENIRIIKDSIIKLDFIRDKFDYLKHGNNEVLRIYLGHCRSIEFIFKKQTDSIKEVTLASNYDYFSAKTLDNFCEKMFDKFYQKKNKETRHKNLKFFYEILSKINNIPQVVSKEYSVRKNKVKENQSYIEKLEKLNISNFC